MPAEMTVSVSDDGQAFRLLAAVDHDVADDLPGTQVRELRAELEGVEARYVRIRARGSGPIPSWHPGHGGKGWIFVDEILID
jgi:hexosaminidase